LINEVNRKLFKKKYNLSGETTNKGLEIYKTLTFISFTPNFGPILKYRVNNLRNDDIDSGGIVILKRIYGTTFRIQFWLSIVIGMLTLIIAFYQYVFKNYDDFSLLIFPIFFIIYIALLYLFTEIYATGLVSNFESILKTENIKYEKLPVNTK